MRRKILSVCVCVLIVLAIFVAVDLGSEENLVVKGATITVDDSGGANYLTIQAAIDAAIPGDTVYVYSGTYIENVVVDKTLNLVGEDNTTTKIDGSWGYGPAVVHITADYVNISNFYVTNEDNPDIGGHGNGIEVDGVHATISRNFIYGGIYGIYLNPPSSHSTIEYNTVTYSSFWAIYGDSSDGNTIMGNTVDTNGDSIQLTYGTQLEVFDNTIRYNGLSGIYLSHCTDSNVYSNRLYDNGGGISLGASSGITVRDNRIWDEHPDFACTRGFSLFGSDGNYVTNNNGTECGYGLYMDSSNENIIESNKFYDCGSGGIDLHYCFNNSIKNNDVIYCMFGIYIDYSGFNNITCNDVSACGGPGMYVRFSGSNNMAWNNIWENLWGFYFQYSDGNEASNNILKDNNYPLEGYAIHLEDSHNNSIKRNDITNNNYGFYIIQSHNNTILANIIDSNNNGIHSESSRNNIIYHNNIIDNTQQAYDDGNSNIWNDTYPSGGNFWSDYSGVDLFKGPGQNISGSDGIGDTNYSIDSNSTDHYPLMDPFQEDYTVLKEGWNLISVPLAQSNTSLNTVLESISGKYDCVQWYDSFDPNDQWKHHKVGKPFGNDLSHLNETMGFWIHITVPCKTMFMYNGTQPSASMFIPLKEGWNLVGYPSLSNKDRTTALNNLVFYDHVDAVWAFKGCTQTWEEIGPSDYFELGRGYWIHATQDCVWEVPL